MKSAEFKVWALIFTNFILVLFYNILANTDYERGSWLSFCSLLLPCFLLGILYVIHVMKIVLLSGVTSLTCFSSKITLDCHVICLYFFGFG
jgi:hypothetical protein